VNVSVVDPPTVRPPEKALSSVGTAGFTVTQAPVVLVPPPAALFEIDAVRFVVAEMALVPLVFATTGQAPVVGDAELVTGTVIVHEVAGATTWREATVIVLEPAVAVTVPPVHVPPVAPVPTRRPAGSVSVKLKVCVGLPVGCDTVNVSVVLAPTVSAPEKALSRVGTAAVTATHAPVVLVPPPAALLEIDAVTFVVAEIALLPFVLPAAGHVETVGVAALVMGTVIVHEVAGATTWREATVMVLLPAVAVTLPPEHVPPVAPLPTTRPAGSVSVKLTVCVGLPAGCETVNVSVVEPPTVKPPEKALSSVGTAAVTATHAPVVLVPPPAALLEIDAVTFVVAEMAPLPLVLLAAGHVETTAGVALVTGTVIVHDVPLTCLVATVTVDEPAVAVTLPPVHVPPVAPLPTTRPAGSVSVKLKVCAGLPAGCETVKVSVVAPPTVRPPEKTLSSVGTAAFTTTHAPVVLVPPPAALFAIAAVMLVMPEICALPLVLFAAGHVETVGAAAVVTGTVIVHDVPLTWREATVIVLLPAVAVTLPPVQVPPAPPLASTRPAGSVSVKL
jgi:hypothetical protein